MSRDSDLWTQAAAKATAPFQRIYLDTEVLRHADWPFVSKQLRFCLDIARGMGLEVYIPEPVRHERAEQWLRGALKERSATATAVKRFA
jgi:hypothetical protein